MAYVEEQLKAGKDVILEIEVQGALQIKEKFQTDTLLLFVTPPNANILKKRLVGRGTEPMAVVGQRLLRASEEAEFIPDYDYLIINDNLEECVKTMNEIIQNEHVRAFRNSEFIKNIREGLLNLSKGE